MVRNEEKYMSRRGENIYKRKDGRWEARFISSHNAEGKAIYKSVYAQSYKAVKRKVNETKNNFLSENTLKRTNLNFGDYAVLWLETVKFKCKISTYNKYKNLYNNHISSFLSKYKPDEIDFALLSKIIDENKALSPKTQDDILRIIKQICNFAATDGYKINLNFKKISIHQKTHEIHYLTVEEQEKLLKYLKDNPDFIKTGILLCLYTGLRIGEVCALKAGDIFLEKGILSVKSTMQRVQIENEDCKTKVIISEPKSQKSVRDIPIPSKLLLILKKQYGELSGDDYILSGKSDKYIEPRTLEYKFKKIIGECNIGGVNFHALRHTFATRCVEADFDIKTLSEILGHANVNITLNTYVHSSMEFKRKNMDKLTVFI